MSSLADSGEWFREQGVKGVELRPTSVPTLEDHIRGYLGVEDPKWGLKILMTQYESQKQKQPFKEGDTVRVRRSHWRKGEYRGWAGYSQMFADAEATVVEVQWNAPQNAWGLTVEYADPYRFVAYGPMEGGGRFYVKDHPVRFYFWPEAVEKVPAPEPDECECCGQVIHG